MIMLDGKSLTIEQVKQVARDNRTVKIEDANITVVSETRDYVERLVETQRVVYGITTGFGKFSDVVISGEEAIELQKNLIISHACGVGAPLAEDVVRAIMLLRVNNLIKGYSGVRPVIINTLVKMLNNGVHPVIPEKGSLGASGDLAPLAHMVLVMIGLGEAFYKGKRLPGAEAMDKAGIEIVSLREKEGLALINGTQVMTAIGCLNCYDAKQLMKHLDIAAAMTVEALNGIVDAFDERLHRVRPHQGQLDTASNMRRLLSDSHLTTNQGELRVQDAYTLRCIPQIHGASKDAIAFVESKLCVEINAVTDNPILFTKDDVVFSGGNFHGQPMALPFDYLAIAVAEMANVSERRIERLVNPQLSGLPAFLTPNGGLHSGFMIAQYAAAALVSENKSIAHPASVDSIPSSANQEDHVSMGTIAARHGRDIIENATNVIGIELLAAAQAIDFSNHERLGVGTRIAYDRLREDISKIDKDRVMHIDFNKIYDIIKTNEIVMRIEAKIGALTM
ncbi:histidine ammonia-lyase [Fusibacter paucivorans]|uniref:Histidine ammonia-lyase n=1 Tax=Fusibacter paucivorans TaxID=76009 RepID=A0ABS5PSG7_9FIRM|nr:histidine ammonia-lyase [Fusibacter paucivorans]MBS7527344.1 histidine ammonia-lyase [Fusibacter paucivorans]